LDSNYTKDAPEEAPEAPNQPASNNGPEFEDFSGTKDPFTKNFNNPRFFVIKNDGSGYELLSKDQLSYYFRIHKNVSLKFY